MTSNLLRLFTGILVLLFTNASSAQVLHDASCGSTSTSFTLDWSNESYTAGSTSQTITDIEGSGYSATVSVSGATSTLTTENGVLTPGITTSLSGGADALHFSSTGLDDEELVVIDISFSPSVAGNIAFDLYNIIDAGTNGQKVTVYAITAGGNYIIPQLVDNGSPSWNLDGPGVADGDATSTAGTNDQVGINFSSFNEVTNVFVEFARCNDCGNAGNTEFAIGDIDFCLVPDTDQDGVVDPVDDDTDNDGILDDVEKCPSNTVYVFDWSNYSWTGAPSQATNTFTMPDGTEMTASAITNGAALQSTDINSDRVAGFGATEETWEIIADQLNDDQSIDISISFSRAIDSLSFTVTDNDQFGGDFTDSTIVIGYYNGFVVFPTLSSSGTSIEITGNTAVGTGPQDDVTGTESNYLVQFDTPIDSISIYYGNGNSAPTSPGDQAIGIYDLTYIGDCGAVDTDGDGVDDYLDIDADNDGIVDYIEWQASSTTPTQPAGTDGDGDGVDDNFESNGDPVDTDGDGIPDFQDLDSDDDGELDNVEAYDGNNDGVADSLSLGIDADGDGLDDQYDIQSGFNSTTNVTNGGQTSHTFPDHDQPGTDERDWRENDWDGDGIQDYADLDDDNDGIPDTEEIASGNDPTGDADGDGIPNFADVSDSGNPGDGSTTDYTDSDADGVPDVYDQDEDGLPNQCDIDADNDGIVDLRESGIDDATIATLDANNDGIIDNGFTFGTNGLVDNLETVADNGTINYTISDVDGDGTYPDFLDLDSDADGIIDYIEAQATTSSPTAPGGSDSDIDGLDNNFESGGLIPVDTDSDGTPDYRDLDSDDDLVSDAIEGWDTDNDGVANTTPSGSDSDGDGIDDSFDDVSGINNTTNITNNGEDAFDFPNLDETGTTERDWREGMDTDGDGIPDGADEDSDNDGLSNLTEGCTSSTTSGDTIDWETTAWGGAPQTLTLNNVNVSISSQFTGTAGTLTNSDTEQGGFGGESSLMTTVNATSSSDSNEIFFSFSTDVDTTTFTLIDIDLRDGSGSQEVIRVEGYNNGSIVYPTLVGGSATSVSGNVVTGTGNSVTPASTGNVTVTFSSTIDSMRVSMTYGASSDANPGNTRWSIHDMRLIQVGDGLLVCNQDTDGDGTPDYLDLDSDDDGILDLYEGGLPTAATDTLDTDGDGVIDDDKDFGTNGMANAVETVANNGIENYVIANTDGNGPNDYLDLDSDNDGILDAAENGNGTDSDNNGIIDGSTDADNDGVLSSADSDDNTIGSPSTTPRDSDGDGIPNFRDLDSDNDGILDLAENGNGTDSDNNGVIDGSTDSDGDGILDSGDSEDGTRGSPSTAPLDTDLDNVANFLDIDSDNDGITDLTESGAGTDANNDGIVDGSTDADGDGYLDSADNEDGTFGSAGSTPTDTDSDGFGNFIDIDADDDGIVDYIEAQATTNSPLVPGGSDSDNDGLDNNFESNGLTPVDTDNDGTPDYLDSDSENDTQSDLIEGWDTDGDGVADTSPAGSDSDGDGLDDNFDNVSGWNSTTNVTNGGQTAFTFPNVDEANTTERDWREEEPDCDGDGLINILDSDDDNDGIPDAVEGSGDFDGDGIINSCDIDSDNDGIPDIVEAGGTDANNDGQVDYGTPGDPTTMVDADGDGLADEYDEDISFNPISVTGDCSGTVTQYDHNISFSSSQDVSAPLSLKLYVQGDFGGGTGSSETIIITGEGATSLGTLSRADSDNPTYGDCETTPMLFVVELTSAQWNSWNDDGSVDITVTSGTGVNFCTNYSCLDSARVALKATASQAGDCSGTTTGYDHDVSVTVGTDDVSSDVILEWWLRGDFGDESANNEDITVTGEGSTNLGTFDRDDSDDNGYDDCETAPMKFLTTISATNWNSWNDDGAIELTFTSGSGVNFCTDYSCLDSVRFTYDSVASSAGGTAIPLTDTDGDGVTDYLDLDSDNDGVLDLYEAINDPSLLANIDTDADGIIDSTASVGENGLADSLEVSVDADSLNYTYANTDGDALNDWLDLDSDNDGITDLTENGNGTDADNNGIVDGSTDVDGDGILSSADSDDNTDGSPNTSPANLDQDDLYNFRDIDADGDGISDFVENDDGTGTDGDNDGVVDGSADNDGDGILDSADSEDSIRGSSGDTPTDTDSDGFDDFLDIDADNDGIVDNTEGQSTSGYVAPSGNDSDDDGLDDSYEGGSYISNPEDTDGDGTDDYRDTDSDDDGLPDTLEGHDSDGDFLADGSSPANTGLSGGTTDADGDGLYDGWDNNTSSTDATNSGLQGTSHPNVDNSATSERDWREIKDSDEDGIADNIDLDDDNDGIPDVDEAGGNDPDGDEDGDGILNFIDTNDDGTGDGSTTDYTDSNSDGIPDVYELDNDGIPNHLDKDSDNDGIVDIIEAGGVDDNEDGEVDYPTPGDPTTMTDADNDGLDDNRDDVDSGSGGGEVTSGTPWAETNTDGVGNPDYLDIDADDDGIVDNTEGQSTSGYTAPSGSDTDLDGIDDAYDPDDGGSYITPVNTEGTGNPDYTDTDSDDDGELDEVEGHDSNGDGTADSGSPASTGVPGGSTDADGDGLLDGYDNETSDRDPTNASLNPNSHPNEDEGGSERDWREVPCANGLVTLAPDNATTTASDFCVNGDWTYYYDPADPTELLFAIEHTPAGGNTNDFTVSVDITASSNPTSEAGVYSAESTGSGQATFMMGRYYNINITSGSLNGNVNIRFYYDTDESDTLAAVADRWNQDNAGGTGNVSGLRWFTMNSGSLDPGSADLQTTGIQGSTELIPSSTSTENGVQFAQFSVGSLTGGGLAYSVGTNSVILPVEWFSFEIEKQTEPNEVKLIWSTVSEKNTDVFVVERSSHEDDGWIEIAREKAAGNSQVLQVYESYDFAPAFGMNYYRIRQVDLDQSFDYSEIRQAKFDSRMGNSLMVYPNPNDGNFNVQLSNPEVVNEVFLMKASGELVRIWNKSEFSDGDLKVSGISAGVYMLQVYTVGEVQSMRIIVN